MDWTKFPLEKMFYFFAGIIPGLTALLIYQQAVPGAFAWFFALGSLGYKTKFTIIVLGAFVVGNTLTTILSMILGAIGGAYGAIIPYRASHTYQVAPWRDPRWRAVLRTQLGTQTPADTLLLPRDLFEQQLQLVESWPEALRATKRAELNDARINAEMADSQWAQWYDHYHQIVLEPNDRDFVWHIRNGFNFNMETTALYVLLSALFVPSLRRWWCILPASIWFVALVAEAYHALRQVTDKWATLSAQIKYLSEARH